MSLPEPDYGTHALSASASLRVQTRAPRPALVILSGEFDMSSAAPLTGALYDLIKEHDAGLRLDMTRVEFCDCGTIRAILFAGDAAPTLGRPFSIGAHTEMVARILNMANAAHLLDQEP